MQETKRLLTINCENPLYAETLEDVCQNLLEVKRTQGQDVFAKMCASLVLEAALDNCEYLSIHTDGNPTYFARLQNERFNLGLPTTNWRKEYIELKKHLENPVTDYNKLRKKRAKAVKEDSLRLYLIRLDTFLGSKPSEGKTLNFE